MENAELRNRMKHDDISFERSCKIKFYCCQLFSLDELAKLENFFVSDSFLLTLLLSV
jgi:hypothetical protein